MTPAGTTSTSDQPGGPASPPAAVPSPTRAETRARRHTELLDAAIAAIRRAGPFASMEQIAAECGITKPIIYRHFGDREGLVAEIAHRFVEEFIDELAPLLASNEPPRDLLTATIDGYLALIERDPNLYRFVSAQVGGDRRDVFAGLVAEQVALVLEQLLADRGLATDATRAWAYGLVGMVHFAGDWWVSAEDRTTTRATLVEQLVTLVWNGAAAIGLDAAKTREPPRR